MRKLWGLFLFVTTLGNAQDSISNPLTHNWRVYKETVFTLGYNHNFDTPKEGNPKQQTLHFIEAGVWRSHVSFMQHLFMATWYGASDFGINTDKFVVGPKVGGFISAMGIGVGGELAYYTDFDTGSLRFIPSLGFMTPWFKLSICPHVPLTNRRFQNMNAGHANLTIRIFKIRGENILIN